MFMFCSVLSVAEAGLLCEFRSDYAVTIAVYADLLAIYRIAPMTALLIFVSSVNVMLVGAIRVDVHSKVGR